MTPKVGEVYMLDLDYQGKVRPCEMRLLTRSMTTSFGP